MIQSEKFIVKNLLQRIVLLFFINFIVGCFNSVSPVWLTSPYFQAARKDVISTLTGNNQTPSFTFTFNSPFHGVPNLAYGISKYQGIDTMGEQYFQVYRTSLTTSTFSVSVQISGSTSLYILNVPYLAMDPTFPHHLNSFDNVPLNYSNGQLVNVSTASTSQTSYTNVINYTAQCGSRTHNTFSYPLQNQQIVLFLSSLFIQTTWPSGSTIYPVSLKVTATILTNQTYKLQLKVLNKTIISRLHFSQLVFDKIDVQSSGKYVIDSEIWITDKYGGIKQIQQEFTDNFIMGIRQFQASNGICSFQYQWNWKSNATFYGVNILQSTTRRSSCGFSQMTSTIFYLKSWRCYDPYNYLNLTSMKCQDECDFYYIQNATVYECIACDHACYICNFSNCITCNALDNRYYINQNCICLTGYFQYYVQTRCRKCDEQILNCLQCEQRNPYDGNITNLQHICTQCSQQYFLNIVTGKCDTFVYCNQTQNSYLNYLINSCEACEIEGCSVCSYIPTKIINKIQVSIFQIGKTRSLTTLNDKFSCIVCDNQNRYFLNYSRLCQICDLNQCLECISLEGCKTCDNSQNYFLNVTSHVCQKCSLAGCLVCRSLYECSICDQRKGYFINSKNQLCVDCSVGCQVCLLSQLVTTCNQCDSSYLIQSGKCNCLKGTYLNLTNFQCQTCHSQCKACYGYSNSECFRCFFQQNRVFSQNVCVCNQTNYRQVGVNVCQKINPLLCDMGYSFSQSLNTCKQICGDGVMIVDQCDDGNSQSRDGCSSVCQIQTNFSCTSIQYQKSQCFFQGSISIVNSLVYKIPSKNVLQIYGQLSPQLKLYKSLDWKNGIQLSGANIQLIDSYMSSQTTLYLQVEYFQNLKHKNIKINFIYVKARLLAATSRNFTFTAYNFNVSQTNNKLYPYLYPQDTYALQTILSYFVFGIKCAIILMILSVCLFKKYWIFMINLMTIQTMYLSLSTLKNIHPLVYSLLGFNHILGFQKGFFLNQQCDINLSLTLHLPVKGCILQNSGIIIQIQLCLLFIVLILYIFKHCNEKQIYKYFHQSVRTVAFLMFVFFSGFLYSASIMDFRSIDIIDLAVIGSLMLIIVVQAYLVTKFDDIYIQSMQQNNSSLHELQKKQKFKQKRLMIKPNTKPTSFFIIFMVFQSLIVIGFGLILYFADHVLEIVCLIIICQSIILLSFKILSPYKDSYLNASIISAIVINLLFYCVSLIQNLYNDMQIQMEQIFSWCSIGIFAVGIINLGLVWSYSIFLSFLHKDSNHKQSKSKNIFGQCSSSSSGESLTQQYRILKIGHTNSRQIIQIEEQSLQYLQD